MVKYTCEKCLKDFTRLDGYTYHINRKNSCIVNDKPKKISKIDELEQKNKEQDEKIQELFNILKSLSLVQPTIVVNLVKS